MYVISPPRANSPFARGGWGPAKTCLVGWKKAFLVKKESITTRYTYVDVQKRARERECISLALLTPNSQLIEGRGRQGDPARQDRGCFSDTPLVGSKRQRKAQNQFCLSCMAGKASRAPCVPVCLPPPSVCFALRSYLLLPFFPPLFIPDSDA